jgi:Rab-GTPase-TBC domain
MSSDEDSSRLTFVSLLAKASRDDSSVVVQNSGNNNGTVSPGQLQRRPASSGGERRKRGGGGGADDDAASGPPTVVAVDFPATPEEEGEGRRGEELQFESFSSQRMRLSAGDHVVQRTGGAAHRRSASPFLSRSSSASSGLPSAAVGERSPREVRLRTSPDRTASLSSPSSSLAAAAGNSATAAHERSCCDAHPPRPAEDEETTDDVEIGQLRERIASLETARAARKAEMKEHRGQQKNNEVVVKEFGMTLHNLKSEVAPMREETERLRVLYEAARTQLEAKEAQITALEEVLHDKAIDTDSCVTSLTDLRAEDAEEAGMIRELKFALDHRVHRELSRLARNFAAAAETDSGVMTASMAIHNHIEQRLRAECIPAVPDAFRGAVWQALAPLSRLKQAEGANAGHLYYSLLEQFSAFETSIDKDILRTFPNEEFRQILLVDGNTDALSNVLKAYSCWDTALGYCQVRSSPPPFPPERVVKNRL